MYPSPSPPQLLGEQKYETFLFKSSVSCPFLMASVSWACIQKSCYPLPQGKEACLCKTRNNRGDRTLGIGAFFLNGNSQIFMLRVRIVHGAQDL